MSIPVLDPRSKADIMEQIRARAAEYTPEWRYEADPGDPGAAIAELFGDMFYQTVDRFNSIPQKTYTEFLNILGVEAPPVTPAAGFMQFNVHAGVSEPVPVPERTQVFARDADGANVVYETERRIEATPARLAQVYYVDPREGMIQSVDMSREQFFFRPGDGQNIQRHRFEFGQDDILTVRGACTVEVEIRQTARFLETATAKRLVDPDFAVWSYYDGEQWRPFDEASAQGGVMTLRKRDAATSMAPCEGGMRLRCDMASDDGSILLDGVSLRTIPDREEQADSLAAGDVPISQEEGGYCFGRRPAVYGLFYIRSDRVFRKRGAQAQVTLDITPIVTSSVDSNPQYSFNKRLIDKKDAVVVKPDDVFVQQVVWEYFNGSGWAALEVSGNKNPFSGKDTGNAPLQIGFSVPEDITAFPVNAELGYYIRARVVNVENYLSLTPRWIAPFVRGVSCTWQYTAMRRADYIAAENNGAQEKREGASARGPLGLRVYDNLPDHPRSMYLAFEGSPHAMPLSMLFDIRGKAAREGKYVYEVWTGSRFEQLRVMDNTRNLSHTGAVFMYITQPLPEADMFGRRARWLRISRSSFAALEGTPPCVGGIVFNTVTAVQRQRAQDQFFSCGAYEAGKRITLLYAPVQECDVWVDEAGSIAEAELAELTARAPGDVRAERSAGALEHCWVRWRAVERLCAETAEQRVYVLDSHVGSITFGRGDNGRVPPRGRDNIRVSTSWGGGRHGNVPAGAVTSFVGSVPRIGSLVNITPMSGGTDRTDTQRLERLGNRRVRHRGRAEGVADFEELVLENFPRAVHVKCFAGLDERGRKAPGHVCVVVMGGDMDGERMAADLCREIYDFLSPRCDCCMVEAGRLHVRPSTEVTVNVSVSVRMTDLDRAAATQQDIVSALGTLIDGVWRKRDIGRQIDISEIYRAVREVPNVEATLQVFIEGVYHEEGRRVVTPIEDENDLPYSTVVSGAHSVRIY